MDGASNVKAFPLPRLYYVRDHEGDQDLLVRAFNSHGALLIWRRHYERDDDDEPTYIGRVPPGNEVGAIDWHDIISTALHYKDLPD